MQKLSACTVQLMHWCCCRRSCFTHLCGTPFYGLALLDTSNPRIRIPVPKSMAPSSWWVSRQREPSTPKQAKLVPHVLPARLCKHHPSGSLLGIVGRFGENGGPDAYDGNPEAVLNSTPHPVDVQLCKVVLRLWQIGDLHGDHLNW